MAFLHARTDHETPLLWIHSLSTLARPGTRARLQAQRLVTLPNEWEGGGVCLVSTAYMSFWSAQNWSDARLHMAFFIHLHGSVHDDVLPLHPAFT